MHHQDAKLNLGEKKGIKNEGYGDLATADSGFGSRTVPPSYLQVGG